MVEKENCGFYVDPESPEDFAQKLIEVKDNKELLRTWGENARALSLSTYDKAILTKQAVDVMERACN